MKFNNKLMYIFLMAIVLFIITVEIQVNVKRAMRGVYCQAVPVHVDSACCW